MADDYEAGRKARETMREAHMKERDDFHAGHKAALAKMAERHEAAIKALHKGEMKKLSGDKKDGADKQAKLYDRKKK